MIFNHIKSWDDTYTTDSRVGQNSLRGFFMASRRTKCHEKLENRIVTNIENKKEEII